MNLLIAIAKVIAWIALCVITYITAWWYIYAPGCFMWDPASNWMSSPTCGVRGFISISIVVLVAAVLCFVFFTKKNSNLVEKIIEGGVLSSLWWGIVAVAAKVLTFPCGGRNAACKVDPFLVGVPIAIGVVGYCALTFIMIRRWSR